MSSTIARTAPAEADTIFFGGGTPSFLSTDQLRGLVDRITATKSWSRAEEITFECEPGTLSEKKLSVIRDIGVTRLSLGVENFDDDSCLILARKLLDFVNQIAGGLFHDQFSKVPNDIF